MESDRALSASELKACESHFARLKRMDHRRRQAILSGHFSYGHRDYSYSLGNHYYGRRLYQGHGYGYPVRRFRYRH